VTRRATLDYEPTIGIGLSDDGATAPGRGRKRRRSLETDDDGDERAGLPDEPPPGWAEP
jgi:hypothetical protein